MLLRAAMVLSVRTNAARTTAKYAFGIQGTKGIRAFIRRKGVKDPAPPLRSLVGIIITLFCRNIQNLWGIPRLLGVCFVTVQVFRDQTAGGVVCGLHMYVSTAVLLVLATTARKVYACRWCESFL